MFFYALTSAGPRGCVESKAWKARGLTTPRGLADVSENHVLSLLLHNVILSLENFGKTLRNLLYYYNGAQKHEGPVGFEKVCSRAKTYVILTSLNYVHFYARY